MASGPTCQEHQGNRSTALLFCILHTTHFPTHSHYIKPMDLYLTPTTQVSAIAMIYPGKTTRSSSLQQPLHILKSPPSCSATSRHFQLPPHSKGSLMTINVSLERANLNSFIISAPDFHVWQHIGSNWSTTHI